MSESESEVDETSSHSAALKRLKSKDPEFYDFLKENDNELLKFQDSESEDEVSEDEEEETKPQPITNSKLERIKQNLQEDPSIQVCKELIGAFKNAVQVADSFSNKKADMSSSDLFNNIMKLCLVELVPALYKVLKIQPESTSKKKTDLSKSKVWRKVSTSVKSYLIDMIKILSVLKESSVLTLLLKHVVHLIPFYMRFMKLARLVLKKMINLWCTNEEAVRVLALLIIVRTTKSLPKEYLGSTLKHMYFAYVKNTKFTSPSTWPLINFMKRSLVELYSLDQALAYEHAFIYIRQLSIHLRNAVTTKKSEAFQTVYNWQYVHCILHWTHLLCTLHENDAIKTLIYPLVQTIIGTINLIPTTKYIPLRFQLVKALIYISQETGTFIPVLPFILDVLTLSDYNKKSNFSGKPVDFSCSLKVTKSQLLEAGFRDSCVAEVCDMLVKYLKIYSHSIGFPELVLPATSQIKSFVKQCKVTKYNQQLKAVLGKITENSSFISEKRRTVTFKITDDDHLKQWERLIKEQGTPILRSLKTENENEDEEIIPKKKQKLQHD